MTSHNILPHWAHFTLMRHGPTAWNLEKRIQGRTQTNLSDLGRKRCQRWGQAMRRNQKGWAGLGPLSRIVSSDLKRAVETAEILGHLLKLPVSSVSGLGEQDWGDWAGRRIRELRVTSGEEVRHQEAQGWAFRPPDGESRLEVWGRASGALRGLAGRYPSEHVLVVTHKGVLKCLLYRLLAMRFLPEEGDPLIPEALHTISVEGLMDGGHDAAAGADSRGDPKGMRILAMNQPLLTEG
ncbi:histidine phosphatase family protein [Desulfonatronum thioautotrophicum]|uniref:histidine phosphatase family protein n=1 Tax=Desulfonatronum thioautotrophicum TaxID=617001 RepID=UPI00069AF571|nr:histidine phosphatase family protein [Desulfonatronum thioautotrophicum]